MVQRLVYEVLVAFLRLVTRIFFRTIEVVGLEHVPATGPVIFVGNHPNSLVDPVVLSTTCGRQVRFAARDGLFASPFLRPILWALGSVPIKRRQDHGADPKSSGSVDNAEAFGALHAVLKSGGAFGIFPEGVSYTEAQLQPLKTGAARIALSALMEGCPVVIVPAGLHYRRKQRYRGRVLVQYGEPIVLDEVWKARQRADPREAAKALTNDIELALRALTLNAPDFETLRVLDGIRRLYVPDARAKTMSLDEQAEITRRLGAHWTEKRDVPEVRAFYDDVESYLTLLDALGLSDWDLKRPVSRGRWVMRVIRHLALLVVQVPLALPGLIIHLPLLWLATSAGEMVLQRDDVRATMRMMIGTGGVLFGHAAIGLALLAHEPTPAGLGHAVLALTLLALSGLAAIRVLERQAAVRHGLRVLGRVFSLRREIAALRVQRDALTARILPLVVAHADPAMVRIVTNDELAARG